MLLISKEGSQSVSTNLVCLNDSLKFEFVLHRVAISRPLTLLRIQLNESKDIAFYSAKVLGIIASMSSNITTTCLELSFAVKKSLVG